ncbi:P-loop NTPase family protein [Siccirubricoccus phaeus]|uniref:hypothetical protein n=1 Tax=Siccirubricoccus phaeus TaxID=2595053 RepID=UPI0011F1CFC1|nr:hypothetical protein [Siccirubricoccus phaeus]
MSDPKTRSHLVERAMEALGGAGTLLRAGGSPATPGGAAPGGAALAPPRGGAAPGSAARPGSATTGAAGGGDALAGGAVAGEAIAGDGLAAGAGVAGAGIAGTGIASTGIAGTGAAEAPTLPSVDAGEAPAAPEPVSLETIRRAGLVVAPGGAERNRASEEMNVVQHQVLRTLRSTPEAEGRCARAILITSARPGEGKTFTALNLAASIATGGGRPAVLVDMDGKRGSLSELLGLADQPGVRALAADPGLAPETLPIPTELPRLSILPYGPAAGGSELPPGAGVVAMLLRLSAALPQHVFVLDSPPCLSTSDPSNLAPAVGQVVMVVQAERTQRDEVEAALDLVEACPSLQLVLNQTRMMSNDSFGAYGAYDVYGSYGLRPGG